MSEDELNPIVAQLLVSAVVIAGAWFISRALDRYVDKQLTRAVWKHNLRAANSPQQ